MDHDHLCSPYTIQTFLSQEKFQKNYGKSVHIPNIGTLSLNATGFAKFDTLILNFGSSIIE